MPLIKWAVDNSEYLEGRFYKKKPLDPDPGRLKEIEKRLGERITTLANEIEA